jgi:integrase
MRSVSNVRTTAVLRPDGSRGVTVIRADGRVNSDADIFINVSLRAGGASPNTLRSYANHIALLFRWLDVRGLDWAELDFEAFCAFSMDLMDGTVPALRRVGEYRPVRPRSANSVRATIAAVYSFLSYWRLEGRGPTDVRLYRDDFSSGRATYNFLAHLKNRSDGDNGRKSVLPLKIRGQKPPKPKIVNFGEDFTRLAEATTSARDRALLSAMFDGGLRISQALGLRHEDIDIARGRVTVTRRLDNPNGAISKQKTEFQVDLPPRFFRYYSDSVTEEQLALGIDSDYVFVNLRERDRGRVMRYGNALQIVKALGRRAGVVLTPHTLRHTHGTALAKAGWSAPMIAARLGHSSASSADVYIHLASDDIAEKYAASSFAREGET